MPMKALLTILFLCSGYLAMAQQPQPVSWTFKLSKDSVSHVYTLAAKANIGDGWHVFTTNPGGDGLLIPTTLTLDNPEKVSDLSDVAYEGKVVSKEMEGVGLVNYFEHEAVFKLQFKTKDLKKLDGMVSFQICNDNMCLPPADVKFNLNIEE